MKVIELPVKKLHEAPWNPNKMDEATLNRLKESLIRYGVVSPLVVRRADGSKYEVLSGNQRLKAIKELDFESAPCIILKLTDNEAMLLAQALNNLHGEDDLGLKGELYRKLLNDIPEDKILALLPETIESLKALSTLGQADLAEHLQAFQEAQAARLRHLQVQLTNEQLETVEEALGRIMAKAKSSGGDNPNIRGVAFYLLCKFYLSRSKK